MNRKREPQQGHLLEPLPTKRRRRRQRWQDAHLSCCLACGTVWRPSRRLTCPSGCGRDLRICLTCNRAWLEEEIEEDLASRSRSFAPGEKIRAFARRFDGDWDEAKRRLAAAHGDHARALAALTTQQRRKSGETLEDRFARDSPEPQPRAHLDDPSEKIRQFVRQLNGCWEEARRRIVAADGDLARALADLQHERRESTTATRPRPRGDRPDLDNDEYDAYVRSGRDPRAAQELQERRRREEYR